MDQYRSALPARSSSGNSAPGFFLRLAALLLVPAYVKLVSGSLFERCLEMMDALERDIGRRPDRTEVASSVAPLERIRQEGKGDGEHVVDACNHIRYHDYMIRTQIQLSEEQAKALRELAAREGRSMADVVRESVHDYLVRHAGADREEIRRRALEVVGRYASEVTDLATDHDRYAVEAFEDC